MADQLNTENAQAILDGSTIEAENLLNDPIQVDQILAEVQERVADLPATVGSALASVPTMVEMIKGYITGEYKDVSPKVVATTLGALLYLVKGKDIIPDAIPIVGLVDDLAVVTLALTLNKPEIEAFQQWRQNHPAIDSTTMGLTEA